MPGKYRGVSAAEKRAELAEKGERPPECECHGESMQWVRRTATRYRAGGYWRCAEKSREACRRWRKTNGWREYKRQWRQEHPLNVFISDARSNAKKRLNKREELYAD